eukprot:g546.t1
MGRFNKNALRQRRRVAKQAEEKTAWLSEDLEDSLGELASGVDDAYELIGYFPNKDVTDDTVEGANIAADEEDETYYDMYLKNDAPDAYPEFSQWPRARYGRGDGVAFSAASSFSPSTAFENPEKAAKDIFRGSRATLSRAITLVESTAPRHRYLAQKLMDAVSMGTPLSVGKTKRIGIAGPPGAGKSTFIEAFGLHLVENLGHRVAVLAIDPSSTRNGGSILGDKTRMNDLSRHENAYVRPSPTRGTLGGVCLGTPEAVQLCEAGGYDFIIVETVGVGQSEVEVDHAVDMTMLLVPPAGGDTLQGVKRGIVEMSDMIVVNKNDGDLKVPVRRTVRAFREALTLLKPKSSGWSPPVCKISALTRSGLEDVYDQICNFYAGRESAVATKRSAQTERWIWTQMHSQLWLRLSEEEGVKREVSELAARVNAREMSARCAAEEAMGRFLVGRRDGA